MEEIITTLKNLVLVKGLDFVWAIVILVVGFWAANLVKASIRKFLYKSKIENFVIDFVSNLAKGLVIIFVIIAALGKLGVNTGSAVAIIGAAGLAIALALQGSLSNFAAGVLIVMLRPFKKDDFIEGGGTMGIVEEIDIFCTRMRTPDNKQVIVPNADILNGNITNYTHKPTRRMEIKIGVSYTDDLDKVKSVLMGLLEADERILKDPAPLVGLLEYGDSSINFVMRPWVSVPDYWDVYWDLMPKIKKAFDANDISIPFPQRDVHLFPAKS